MQLLLTTPTRKFLLGGFAMALLALPLVSYAQTAQQDELRATIKAQLMADPRSSGMSPAQINAMVDTLAIQAQKQGVTADQLSHRPQDFSNPEVSDAGNSCGAGFLCTIDRAFGFLGSNSIIPIALFILSALFILVFSLMREMGHPHTQFVKDTPSQQ